MDNAALVKQIEALQASVQSLETNHNESLDTIWMLLASLLVFFMHAGFSLLETGSVRFKNTQNILAKNLIVVTLGFIVWFFIGFPLALGSTDNPSSFAGSSRWAMSGFWENKSELRLWFFQGAFCATGATIVSGAMAERTQIKGFCIFTSIMTGIIYPIVVYWTWSGHGFLNFVENGTSVSIVGPAFVDFAGSGIVHMVGGVAALCGAIIVRPRMERFNQSTSESFDAYSVPFCVLGTFILWVGWYGFNPGSTGSMHDIATANTAGLVAVNTTLAPCAAGLLVFFLRAQVVQPKKLDVGGFCNGILAGLVSITGGCSTVEPWEAIIIGFLGGFVYQGASMLLKKLKVDDVVDAFPVHGACGAWGVIAVGLFGNPNRGIGGNGAFYGGDQLGTQLVGGIIIACWAAAFSCLIFVPLKLAGLLRLSDEFQIAGCDIKEHKIQSDNISDAKANLDITIESA